jgi:hypothetical protein
MRTGNGFVLGLFGTIALGSESRIFGGFGFVFILILVGVLGVAMLLKRALQSGSDGGRVTFRDNSYDWNAARPLIITASGARAHRHVMTRPMFAALKRHLLATR